MSVSIAELVTLVIGIAGLGGLIFTALSWRRNDTTAVVQQQSTILNDMKGLNDELRQTEQSLKAENVELREHVQELTDQVSELREQLDRFVKSNVGGD